MPGRRTPLVNGEIYHIVNRGITSQIIFSNKNYDRALETIFYYQSKTTPLRYSYFIRLPKTHRWEILDQLRREHDYLAEIIAYCLMPTHFHLLLKQQVDNGISRFMNKFSNSYTRYFNVKNKRLGPIFQGRFKSVRVESEQQLLHVSRYIHLNPYSSGIVKSLNDLRQYPHSSLAEYLGLANHSFCQKDVVLDYFKKPGSYQEFVFNQADYQRELEVIKHVILETE